MNVLVIFNWKEKIVKMLSILCDVYVNISGYGYDKFIYVYVYGGVDFIVKIVEEMFDIFVDYVVESNFIVFEDVVN